jgi:thiamine pyrophosphate-dependent acetolactate synthase large subunit-like protein
MKVADAIAEIMKREGIEILCAYPVNHVIEHAAMADIRPIIVRQERTGIHMADAISRLSSGKKIGAFAMQLGPGTENSYGAIAQAYSESVPILVLPGGYPRKLAHIAPNYNSTVSMRSITKMVEPLNVPADIPNASGAHSRSCAMGGAARWSSKYRMTSGTKRYQSRWTIGRW